MSEKKVEYVVHIGEDEDGSLWAEAEGGQGALDRLLNYDGPVKTGKSEMVVGILFAELRRLKRLTQDELKAEYQDVMLRATQGR